MFRQTVFLLKDFFNGFGNSSAVSSYLDIFLKPNLFLKLSNHPLLALNSQVLGPSLSIYFKLPYNDFAFSQIMLCRPQSVVSNNSTSSNVVTFLCFLGARLASLLAFYIGPMVLFT